jgi:hypothetical protein
MYVTSRYLSCVVCGAPAVPFEGSSFAAYSASPVTTMEDVTMDDITHETVEETTNNTAGSKTSSAGSTPSAVSFVVSSTRKSNLRRKSLTLLCRLLSPRLFRSLYPPLMLLRMAVQQDRALFTSALIVGWKRTNTTECILKLLFFDSVLKIVVALFCNRLDLANLRQLFFEYSRSKFQRLDSLFVFVFLFERFFKLFFPRTWTLDQGRNAGFRLPAFSL